MKEISNVHKSSIMVTKWPQKKSMITGIKHVYTLLALLMLCLFGVNENAWATWPTYEGTITQSGSTYYVVNDNNEHTLDASGSGQSLTYKMGGPGDELSMYARRTRPTAVGDLVVKSYNNDDEKDNVYQGNPAGTNYSVLKGYQGYGDLITRTLTTKAVNKLIFSAHLGSYSKQFKTVKVTMFSGVLQPKNAANNANITTWTYTAADYAAENSYKDFTVDWSNVTSLSMSKATNGSSDDRSQFSYEIFSNTKTLAKGNYGTATIRVKYKHDKVGTHSVKINVGSYSITFTGTTNKITPYIDTTPTVDTITYGQTISNSQLGTGLVKANLINAAGTVVPGTWTIDENGQTIMASGGSNTTVHLTFTPTDGNTYNVLHTTQTMFVRSASTISWASAYSATKPTIPIGKTIEGAATTNAAGATVTYSSSNPNIIVIENEGTAFRAIAEGEAKITASHGVTATHGEASEEKTFKTTYKDIQVIVWTDRFDRLTTEMTSKNLLAQIWIENPSTGERTYSAERTALLEYSVGDNTVVSIPNNSTTLTIHKKGNTTITASVEGDDQYEEASVTMVVKVREPSEGCDDPLLLDIKNNGTNDYLYRLFSGDTKKPALYTDEYAINVAQGQVPDKLSFAHKGEEYKVVGLSIWTYYSGTIKAQQKVDGNWIDVPNSSVAPEKSKWNTIEGLQLNEKATHIRFVRPQGGEGYHYVRDVEVTMKHFIRTATPTVDFGNTIKVNSSEYQDVVVKYSNVKDALQVVNPFTSDVTVSDEVIDVDSCGAFGSATLRISFSPTTATEIDNYIVVKDPVVGNSSALSIRVKADVQRADQEITWSPETSISTIDQILLNGTTNGQEYGQMNVIGYEVTNNDGVISVTNNVVTILKPGTVTITASQPGTANYDVAEPVEKNFTISAEPLTLVAPTAQGITYGQALSESELTGGSAKDSKGNDVYGTFAWQAGGTTPNASDDAQGFTVVFTPSTNAAWYTNLTTTATINVEKVDPVATVENVSFVYGTKAENVALTGTGAGTWTWTDSHKGETLGVGEYEMDVHFAPTDNVNYNAIDTKITLTVTKADPAATVENVSFAYGIMASSVGLDGTGDGEWSWDDERANQTLNVGVYNDVAVKFTPTDGDNYNVQSATITITVTKADPDATANAVVITYGATASSVDLEGTGLAGTWTWTDSRKDDVLAAGEYTMDVHFVPTDATNYNEKDATVTLTVNKAASVATPSAAAITVGQAVSTSVLTNSGTEGTWAWDDAVKNNTPAAGTYQYTVHFTPDNANYTTLTTTITLQVNAAVNEFTGTGDWENPDNWSGKVIPSGIEPNVIVKGALSIDESITVGNLTIENTGSVAVITGGALTVKGTSEYREVGYGDIHVLNDGAIHLDNSADLQVRHFTLDAKLAGKNNLDVKEAAASGQVENPSQLSINGDAYFQMAFDPKGKISFGWYDFVVPFPVNISDGIFREGDLTNHLVSGVDFIVQEYSESKCANNQKAWSNFSGTMQPGRVYTITFNYSPTFDQNVFVFKKASGATIGGPTEFATQYTAGSGTTDDFGWNGLGNGTLQHGYITGAFAHMQVYNHAENKYDLLTGKNPTFAIGTSFFVQVDNTTPTMEWITTAANEDHPLYAPRRAAESVEEFLLSLREENQFDACDHFYISESEEATETYVIGHDLRKMGNPTEAKTAQMWAIKNGKKLCDIETRIVNYGVSSNLNFFAPQAGSYELTVEEMPEDAALYLTYNGAIIWDLTASPYMLDLTKGTTVGYGLRIAARRSPQVTTGIETVNAENGARKVLIDNKIYIVTPEGKMYDVVGKSMKQ